MVRLHHKRHIPLKVMLLLACLKSANRLQCLLEWLDCLKARDGLKCSETTNLRLCI